MKKLIVVLVLILGSVCQANGKKLSAWLLGNDTSLGARLGYCLTDKTEIGAECVWLKENEVPQTWAAYGLYKLPDTVKFPNPLPLEFLPKEFTATPYIGIETGLTLDKQGTFICPIAGLVIEKILVIEYFYVSSDFQLKAANQNQGVRIGFTFSF